METPSLEIYKTHQDEACSNWHREGRRDLGNWFAAQELELMARQLMARKPKQGMLEEWLTAPGSPSLEKMNFGAGTLL